MGRKSKSKEEKDENRRIRQKRYYDRNRKRICEKRMEKYWKKVGKKLSEL
jgi:hypothetical protein